jgi:hypothetical protein
MRREKTELKGSRIAPELIDWKIISPKMNESENGKNEIKSEENTQQTHMRVI